jgi:hypothetical protein
MITWIIHDDQALHVVDSNEFRDMIKSFNTTLHNSHIPTRNTVQSHIVERYMQDRQELKKRLQESMGRISLTTDLWSSNSMKSFMALTLHWIARTQDGELKLMTALGGFRYVKNKHSGENIAENLINILKELDILDRVGGITLDNASNNDRALECFEEYLTECGLKYSCEQKRVRCFHM